LHRDVLAESSGEVKEVLSTNDRVPPRRQRGVWNPIVLHLPQPTEDTGRVALDPGKRRFCKPCVEAFPHGGVHYCGGGWFIGHPEVLGGADRLLPVDLNIPGCPPTH